MSSEYKKPRDRTPMRTVSVLDITKHIEETVNSTKCFTDNKIDEKKTLDERLRLFKEAEKEFIDGDIVYKKRFDEKKMIMKYVKYENGEKY